jgi:NAD(P)H-flavin reductase
MVKSNQGLNYQLIHGVRYAEEGYEQQDYNKENYVLCTSRDKSGDFNGRVTDYLKKTDFDKNTCFYLCGNSDMIFDSMEILSDKGFGRENITVEVYF